jgi:hypothetical protein
VSWSQDYPTPEYLRSVTKQGATSKAGSQGYGTPTEASEWIAEVAMRPDPRPLWITVWGGIEDVAQALHDHPEIESRLRVYWIAGPNRRNSPNASKYIANNHKNLWIIEADETYRGFFNGGDMSGDLSNSEFLKQHVQGHGALGDYLMSHRKDIKMGDTPAVLYTIDNEIKSPGDPTQPGWGGAFIPCGGDRPNCWKDDPSKSSNGYDGAATVNIHREAFLRDFQAKMDRAQSAANTGTDTNTNSGSWKPRLINTSDIGGDPDDMQSFVHQLVVANEFDLEGLIVTTGCWNKNQSSTADLDRIVDAYGEVLPNLQVHAEGYPSLGYMRSISVMGQTSYGMGGVGQGRDSDGSELIIAAVDKDDPRPVWVTCWGGCSTGHAGALESAANALPSRARAIREQAAGI